MTLTEHHPSQYHALRPTSEEPPGPPAAALPSTGDQTPQSQCDGSPRPEPAGGWGGPAEKWPVAMLQGRWGRESPQLGPSSCPPAAPPWGHRPPPTLLLPGYKKHFWGNIFVLTGLLSFSTETTLECPGHHRRRPNPDQAPELPEGFVTPHTTCPPLRMPRVVLSPALGPDWWDGLALLGG